MKRAFDVVVSVAVIALASPLWALIALAIVLESPGPVFHRSLRIGKDGRPFTLFKFRTMRRDAAHSGPAITRHGDPRITRVGKFLRDYKIDEMPQLINVVRGEMSIVGPRPEDPRFVADYSEEQRRVLSVRPGMASPTFIRYRHEERILAEAGDVEETYRSTILPRKLQMDLEYVDNASFRYDLEIIAHAARSLFTSHQTDD